MSVRREFGIVGLGKMGAGVAAQALGREMTVAGNDIAEPPQELVDAVFVYVPAGR